MNLPGAEFIGLFTTILTCFGYAVYEMKHIERRLENSIQAQSARSDKLYEMFYDLLKEKK